MLLKDLNSPSQLKNMNMDELNDLCSQIREKIISTVSVNGGHLSSNLGDVELTIALHRALNCPEDKIIFDVGHQCYAHKLITGRFDRFDTLRKTNGLCGFPRRSESEYDCFNTGHASNAISAALGMARARDILKADYKVAVVIGDGAMTGGMAFEGLNDAGNSKTQLLIILNDNGMSISGNVGAVSNYLTHLRVSKGWQNLKKGISAFLLKLPWCGKKLHHSFQHIKNKIRNIFIKDRLFTALGIHYFGPIDGSDIHAMESVIRRIKEFDEPCLLHVYTQKGCGFRPAEDRPDAFHGTPPFRVEDGHVYAVGKEDFGEAACSELMNAAESDKRISVVTAAMAYGTGMLPFYKKYPDRSFDVGIAEEHAITLSGGMALSGMRPFTAIYDSFLQRAYDQIAEDVAMQKAPVCILCDRAGIGSNDGASHHGIFGMSFLSSVPGLTILSPMNRQELRLQLRWLLSLEKGIPAVIRYPKSEESSLAAIESDFKPGRWQVLRNGNDAVLISVSSLLVQALKAADLLEKRHLSLCVINASTLKPLDGETLRSIHIPIFTAEENVASGSLGEAISLYLLRHHLPVPRDVYTVDDSFVPHGDHIDLLHLTHLDAHSLADRIEKELRP